MPQKKSKFVFLIVLTSLLVSITVNAIPNTNNQQQNHNKNIFSILGRQFHLPDETPLNRNVKKQIDWYMKNPKYLKTLAEQSRPYLYYIYQEINKRGLPVELTLLPMVESAYDPFAYSRVGAAGLWQMMPGTASGFGLKVNWWYDGRRDIVASTNSALDYLSYLGNFFNNNWLLAIAAYDTGEGTIVASIKHNIKLGRPTNFWYLSLPLETQRYIPKLLALATIIKFPFKYHINWPFVPNSPYFVKIDVGCQIDLAHASKMAGISLKELSKLNPGFNHWTTDPNGPHQLLLPIDKASRFKEQLARLPKEQRIIWTNYQVKKGDTLSSISRHFKTSVALLKKSNHLKNDIIRPKQILLIPHDTTQYIHLVKHSKKYYLEAISKDIPEILITNHIVKKGDTLSKIATLYHVTQKDIKFWNGLSNDESLKLGKKLIIWPSKSYFTNKPIQYKIKRGDTLSQIAYNNHTSVEKLRKVNNLKNDILTLGKILIIPKNHIDSSTISTKTKLIKNQKMKKITHYVKTGETLEIISKKYKVTIQDIKRWNQIKDINQIKTNQSFVIYA